MSGVAPTSPRHRRQPASSHKAPPSVLNKYLRDVAVTVIGKNGQYIITVVSLPLLARLLGASEFGLYGAGMGAYFSGSVFIDWGLTVPLAAESSRKAAQRLRELQKSYFTARSIALLGMIAIAASSYAFEDEVLQIVALGFLAGGLSSMSEEWLLLGSGRFGAYSASLWVGRGAYVVALCVLLPVDRSAWVPMIALIAGGAATAASTWRSAGRPRFGRLAPSDATRGFRLGGSIVISKLLTAGYGQGFVAVASSRVEAATLGFYSVADRLVRALQGVLDSLGYALFPRMVRRHVAGRVSVALVGLLALGALVAGLAVAILVWTSAPLLVDLLYGPQYHRSVAVLRIGCFILPAASVAGTLANSVIIPGRRSVFLPIPSAIGFSVVLLGLFSTSGPAWRPTSLAWLVLGAEVGAAIVCLLLAISITQRQARSSADTPNAPRAPGNVGRV